MNEANAPSTEPKLENFTSLTQSRNSSFQSVQRLPQSPFSNFSFSPKQGRSNIAAQFQTNNSTNVGDNSAITQPLQQQTFQPWHQSECLKTQPLNENTRDEELKAELKWKIWKFQRNVKKLIDHMAVGDNGDYLQELNKLIADTRISQEFPGVSEVSVTVKLLLEKVINNVKFENVAVKVCTLFRGIFLSICYIYAEVEKEILKKLFLMSCTFHYELCPQQFLIREFASNLLYVLYF